MRTNTRLVLPFFYALLISACSNNDNYPKEYIGFEKQFISHTYDTKNEEETLTLKIIAAEKQDTDRKLTISSSTSNNSFPHSKCPSGHLERKEISKNRYHSLS